MHDALLISEILDRVLDNLEEDIARKPTTSPSRTTTTKDTRTTGLRALAVLARTCHVLSEPALDALWRKLYSLRPLVLCLPTTTAFDDIGDDDALVRVFFSHNKMSIA